MNNITDEPFNDLDDWIMAMKCQRNKVYETNNLIDCG